MSEIAPGAILAGRYRVDRKLGEGGMGIVLAATHVVTRQSVALKLLQTDQGAQPKVVQRFLREARAASAVRHPNVVVIHDVLELDDRTPMMVMELLDGESLGERLERDRKLPIHEVARILLPVVSAVGTAHTLGIVHRDLKPDNIFLAMTPDGLVVKVLDFGIAKLSAVDGDAAATGNLTGSGALLGTPYYMAPEQIYGERDIDHRADVWALGVILYECLAGVKPTQADNIGQILKIVTTGQIDSIRQLVPTLPSEVAALVMRMLSRDREARPSMKEVHASLAQYTDVTVRPFGEPVSRQSRASLPDSSGQVIRVSDSARPLAPTVHPDGDDPNLRAIADTIESLDQSRPGTLASTTRTASMRAKSRSIIGVALGAVAIVAGTFGLRAWTATRAAAAPIASPTSPVVTPPPSATVEREVTSASVEPRIPDPPPSSAHAIASAAVVTTTKRPVVTPPPTVSATPVVTVKSPASATANPGGVVEKPPF